MAVRQRTRLKRAPKTVIPDFPGHMADTTPTQPSFETDRSGLPCRRQPRELANQASKPQQSKSLGVRGGSGSSVMPHSV